MVTRVNGKYVRLVYPKKRIVNSLTRHPKTKSTGPSAMTPLETVDGLLLRSCWCPCNDEHAFEAWHRFPLHITVIMIRYLRSMDSMSVILKRHPRSSHCMLPGVRRGPVLTIFEASEIGFLAFSWGWHPFVPLDGTL